MKVQVYRDHTDAFGTIELGEDNLFHIVASAPSDEDFLKKTLAHWYVNLSDETGQEPTNEQVLAKILEAMPEGRRYWCEKVKE